MFLGGTAIAAQTWPSPRTKEHTTSPDIVTEMASRNSDDKDRSLLRGVDPGFLRHMCFAKKHNKKSLMNIQTNDAKAVSAPV